MFLTMRIADQLFGFSSATMGMMTVPSLKLCYLSAKLYAINALFGTKHSKNMLTLEFLVKEATLQIIKMIFTS